MLSFLPTLQQLKLETARAPLAAALALCATLLLVSAVSKKRQKSAHGDVAVPPTTLPVLGNLLDLVRNNDTLHDWMYENAKRCHPKPFVIRAPGRADLVVISTPEAFEDVVKTQFDVFGKGPGIHMRLSDLLGDSLTLLDGDRWRIQRKILVGLFSARAMRDSISSIIRKNARVLLGVLTPQAEANAAAADKQLDLDLSTLMGRFTLEVFMEVGFGLQLGGLEAGEPHPFETAFDRAQIIGTMRYTTPTPVWKLKRLLGLGVEGEMTQCLATINETVLSLIARAVEAKHSDAATGRKDIVSLAVEALGDEELDPSLLRALAMSALVAGRDTTAQTLCWFVYMLTQNPRVEQKLRAEVLTKLPKLAEDAERGASPEESWLPASDDVQDLTYLEACLKETLRLYPAAALNARVANKDTFLSDGTFVPEGASVLLPSYGMGRLTGIWGDDALEYKPERWIDENTGKLIAVSPFQFNSFLAGPRMCVGMNLAMLEMKVLASTLLSRFHFALTPGQHVTYMRSISLPMKQPLRVRVQKAEGVQLPSAA